MLGVGEGSEAKLVEVEQEEAQMNKHPKRRRLNLFSQILPAPLHYCFVLFLC
jgi:hypothetical protein